MIPRRDDEQRADRALPALRAVLRPSFELAVLLAAAHIGAAGVCLYALPGIALQAMACGAIALDAYWVIARHALLRHRGSVVGVELAGEEACVLRTRDGGALAGKVLPSTYVTLGLIVLNVRVSGQRIPRPVVIWRDSVASQERRRLRVRLRWAWEETAAPARTHAPL